MDAESDARAYDEEKAGIARELDEVATSLLACDEHLSRAGPEYQEKKTALEYLRLQHEHMLERSEALFSKQGRGRQFKTKKDRDAFLQDQIEKKRTQQGGHQSVLSKMALEVQAETQRIEKEENHLQLATVATQQGAARGEEIARSSRELKSTRNESSERRKQYWKELEVVQEKIRVAKQEFKKGHDSLNSALPKHIISGLDFVER